VNSQPPKAFSANFNLQGTAEAGDLNFSSPLGTTLARLVWSPSTASLQTTGDIQHFESLGALVNGATGTDLPLAALFSWLQGVPADAPGWRADLTDMANGRLTAQRFAPDSPTELKIILDR